MTEHLQKLKSRQIKNIFFEKMPEDILEDTTLTMIVRDEARNPAGGISRNLPILLPHVEEAVVVDTGSIDKTLKILKKIKKKISSFESL